MIHEIKDMEKNISELLPTRNEKGDKRAQGCALVIAGSKDMPGAAALCTKAALRSGAGLVTLASPRRIVPILQAKLSEPVFISLEDCRAGGTNFAKCSPDEIGGIDECDFLKDRHVPELLKSTKYQQAVAIGPGLGQRQETRTAVRNFVTRCKRPETDRRTRHLDAPPAGIRKTLRRTSARLRRAPRIPGKKSEGIWKDNPAEKQPHSGRHTRGICDIRSGRKFRHGQRRLGRCTYRNHRGTFGPGLHAYKCNRPRSAFTPEGRPNRPSKTGSFLHAPQRCHRKPAASISASWRQLRRSLIPAALIAYSCTRPVSGKHNGVFGQHQ